MNSFLDHYRAVKTKMLSVEGATVTAFALVALTKEGEEFWAGDFGENPEKVLKHLDHLRKDIKHYIKTHGQVTSVIGRVRKETEP